MSGKPRLERREKRPIGEWNGETIAAGESRDLVLTIGENHSGADVAIPVHVRRGQQEGPVVFVTAALHGDEINGTGTVRSLILDETLQLERGALILVPVVNVPGFDRHSRYLPDRRDLNRCFPGSATGSLASRMARIVFDEIVSRSDFGIDLHTAAVRRTNYPNVRGDLAISEVERLATAFGCEFILNSAGPKGSFRREACRAGCPTIVLEAGEVWKVEPSIVESAVHGVRNVLSELGLITGDLKRPPFQKTLDRTKWIRAERGGFLHFHVAPGETVKAGQPLATNTSLLGREQNVLTAPFDAIVIGMTTLPTVGPGEPVCNLGHLMRGRRKIERIIESLPEGHLHDRVIGDLASNVMVVEPGPSTDSPSNSTDYPPAATGQ
ncbi:succinate dehydrogenase [bacterium]|nr:succinate dehydrogenase [bacterium]